MVSVPDDSLPTPFTWTASDRIWKAMTLQGMDRQDLIEATGLNKNTVSDLLPNKRSPERDLSKVREVTWRAISNALGVSLTYLRDGEDA